MHVRHPDYCSNPKPIAGNAKTHIKYINCSIITQVLILEIIQKLGLMPFSKDRLICTDLSATTTRLFPV